MAKKKLIQILDRLDRIETELRELKTKIVPYPITELIPSTDPKWTVGFPDPLPPISPNICTVVTGGQSE